MILIPLYQTISADFEEIIELNSQLMTIRITYNTRSGYFFITITNQNGATARGIKVVPNYMLLNGIHAYVFEDGGNLIVQKDVDNIDDVITYENFGRGWNLYYFDSSEVESWMVENGLA